MANPQDVEMLKKGTVAWNNWRAGGSHAVADLRHADLSHADLFGADLSGIDLSLADLSCAKLSWACLLSADLRGAKLANADLTYSKLVSAHVCGASMEKADLCGADLNGADLRRASLVDALMRQADLRRADLSGADLREANLRMADLSGANLFEADLRGSDLREANLDGTELTSVKFGSTILANVDLSDVRGLDRVEHYGPSTIGFDTFFNSKGKIPEVFLRGAGVPDIFLQFAASLAGQPFEFYSCFISYSHTDKSFAEQIHDSLQGKGVRCWFDEKQLLPGDHIHEEIDKAVRLWDKVLLCCSKASLTSWWVDKEVSKALKKEEQLWKERGKQVLAIIPLNLDGYMFDTKWNDWKKQHLTDRLAADFTGWDKDNAKFEEQLERVLKALRADAGARESPPKPRL